MQTNTIRLPTGETVLVDATDWELVGTMKWHRTKSARTRWVTYASANVKRSDGKQVRVLMHRLLLRAGPGQKVDHLNSNGLDNRRSNLRFCTSTQNAQHMRKRPNTVSEYKGVTYYKPCPESTKVWRARIRVEKRLICLGRYETEIDAAAAYDNAAKLHFGEFALLNFPVEVSRE